MSQTDYPKGDWIDVLRKHILTVVHKNGGLGFYGVILHKGGKTETIMVGHPELPVQHLYDHVLQSLNEDIEYEAMK